MKRTRMFVVSASLMGVVLLSGCRNDEITLPSSEEQPAAIGHVPVSVQQENLQRIFADRQIAESVLGEQTRAGINVNSVQTFGKHGEPLTRAQEENAYYYLFDLDGQGNYALMGANVTVPPSAHQQMEPVGSIQPNDALMRDRLNRQSRSACSRGLRGFVCGPHHVRPNLQLPYFQRSDFQLGKDVAI